MMPLRKQKPKPETPSTPPPPPLPPIFTLPSELWCEIASFLPLHSVAALTFTCKTAHERLGDQFQAIFSPNNAHSRLEFSLLLEKECGDQILCPASTCNIYHSQRPNKGKFKTCNAFEGKLKLDTRLPSLDWATVYQVMKRVRLGPGYGRDMSILKHSGKECYWNVGKHTWSWTVKSVPRICNGHLVIRLRYRLRMRSDPERQDDHPLDPRTVMHTLRCAHSSWADAETALGKFLQTSKALVPMDNETVDMGICCRVCRSECVYTIRPTKRYECSTVKRTGRVFIFDRYLNFGECLPTDTRNWNALRSPSGSPVDDFSYTRIPRNLWEGPVPEYAKADAVVKRERKQREARERYERKWDKARRKAEIRNIKKALDALGVSVRKGRHLKEQRSKKKRAGRTKKVLLAVADAIFPLNPSSWKSK